MLHTPCSKKLAPDWDKPAESLTNENEPADLGKCIGEYLRNSNALWDFMVRREKYDAQYVEWCVMQGEHISVRQNHMDAAVISMRNRVTEIKEQVRLGMKYDEARVNRLDNRLETIEKKSTTIAPVNMAKMTQNTMRDCMGNMV